MAVRNLNIKLPSNVLSDDAYISYYIRYKNLEIAYTPKAMCCVKYPTNFKDYMKQKVRSLGGYTQLQQMGIFKKINNLEVFGLNCNILGLFLNMQKL